LFSKDRSQDSIHGFFSSKVVYPKRISFEWEGSAMPEEACATRTDHDLLRRQV
jgi:hypothetical protein